MKIWQEFRQSGFEEFISTTRPSPPPPKKLTIFNRKEGSSSCVKMWLAALPGSASERFDPRPLPTPRNTHALLYCSALKLLLGKIAPLSSPLVCSLCRRHPRRASCRAAARVPNQGSPKAFGRGASAPSCSLQWVADGVASGSPSPSACARSCSQ